MTPGPDWDGTGAWDGAVGERSVMFVRHLDHDFNHPTNEGGFHEVVLPDYFDPPRRGDIVDIGDSELRQRGRVRVLVAIVEPVEDYRDVK